jgi:hypothetical protein
MVTMPVIPAGRQEDHKFEASVGYIDCVSKVDNKR